MNISDLFSNEKVNTGRQIELDIAKGLSIIFMVFLHTLMVVPAFNADISSSYNFIISNVLGRPFAAPIFMFCMGVGIVYSRHSQWDVMIKRGVHLFLLGILVNVFEFYLPGYVCGTLLGRWDIFPMAGGLLLFCVDILAFAGLAFILMGILKRFKLSNKKLIIVAVIMSLIGTIIRFTNFGFDVNPFFTSLSGSSNLADFPLINSFLYPLATYASGSDFGLSTINLFFANFVGSEGKFGAFPLFNWFIFPIAGYVWGQYFIRAKDKGKFFKFWPVLIIISLIYFFASSQAWGGVFSDDVHFYYFMTTLDAIFCIINAHGVIGLCYWIAKYLPDKIIKVFSILSSNITYIYIFQWLFIPLTVIFISYFFKDLVLTDWISTIISICMIILSTVCALYYKKLKSKIRGN